MDLYGENARPIRSHTVDEIAAGFTHNALFKKIDEDVQGIHSAYVTQASTTSQEVEYGVVQRQHGYTIA